MIINIDKEPKGLSFNESLRRLALEAIDASTPHYDCGGYSLSLANVDRMRGINAYSGTELATILVVNPSCLRDIADDMTARIRDSSEAVKYGTVVLPGRVYVVAIDSLPVDQGRMYGIVNTEILLNKISVEFDGITIVRKKDWADISIVPHWAVAVRNICPTY